MKKITSEQLLAETNTLRELWQTLFDSCPADSQFARWLAEHPLERMIYAVTRTGVRYAWRTLTRYEPWYRVNLVSKFADEQQAEEWREERERKGIALLAGPPSELRTWYSFNSTAEWRLAMSNEAEDRKSETQ